jgi:lambda family phage holin
MSKMPEKSPDIWVQVGAWLLTIKEQGIGGSLAFIMAYLRGRYNGGKFWRVVIDALMCAMIAWFIRDMLNFVGMNTNLSYIGSVFIGYLGTDYIGSLLKRVIGNKSGTGTANPS